MHFPLGFLYSIQLYLLFSLLFFPHLFFLIPFQLTQLHLFFLLHSFSSCFPSSFSLYSSPVTFSSCSAIFSLLLFFLFFFPFWFPHLIQLHQHYHLPIFIIPFFFLSSSLSSYSTSTLSFCLIFPILHLHHLFFSLHLHR